MKYPYQVEMYDDYIAGGAPQEFIELEDETFCQLLNISRKMNLTTRQCLEVLIRDYLPLAVKELQNEKI